MARAFVHHNLGLVCSERGEAAEALAEFRRAATLDPAFGPARLLAGASLLALERPGDAIPELERAVDLMPREVLAHLRLADAYERMNDVPHLVDTYRVIVALAPGDAEYAYRLGRAYLKLSEWSLERARHRRKPKPESQSAEDALRVPAGVANRAEIDAAIQARAWDRAERLLAAEIEGAPRSADLLTLIARIFMLDRKPLNAAVAIKKAEAIGPIDNRTRLSLALAYISLGRGDWARPELERLAASDDSQVLYPCWLARIDYDDGRYAAAIERLKAVLARDPAFMRAYDNLGLCYGGPASARTRDPPLPRCDPLESSRRGQVIVAAAEPGRPAASTRRAHGSRRVVARRPSTTTAASRARTTSWDCSWNSAATDRARHKRSNGRRHWIPRTQSLTTSSRVCFVCRAARKRRIAPSPRSGGRAAGLEDSERRRHGGAAANGAVGITATGGGGRASGGRRADGGAARRARACRVRAARLQADARLSGARARPGAAERRRPLLLRSGLHRAEPRTRGLRVAEDRRLAGTRQSIHELRPRRGRHCIDTNRPRRCRTSRPTRGCGRTIHAAASPWVSARFTSSQLEEARGDLEQATRHPDTAAGAHYFLGRIARQLNDLATARRELDACLQAQPAHADAWAELGLVQTREGQYAEAERSLARALAIDADHYAATLNLAALYGRMKRSEARGAKRRGLRRSRETCRRGAGLSAPHPGGALMPQAVVALVLTLCMLGGVTPLRQVDTRSLVAGARAHMQRAEWNSA